MVTSLNTLNMYSYSSFVSGGGKLYVPVSRGVLLYSHFNHVSGIAVRKGQQGVSINKLTILNSLIDQLIKMKENPVQKTNTSKLDSGQIDALIEKYQKQIKSTIDNVQIPQTLAGVMPEPGMIFSIQV